MLGMDAHTRRIRSSLILLIFMAATCVAAQEPARGISPAARTYLEQALDLMQKNALNKSFIDWAHLREESLARAKHAQAPVDTYPAITFALTQLKEHHSFLQLPDGLPATQRNDQCRNKQGQEFLRAGRQPVSLCSAKGNARPHRPSRWKSLRTRRRADVRRQVFGMGEERG